jgi:hypothetical protein
MAAMGKEHPLNIFRNNPDGFRSASRSRRTVKGKVVASAPRATTRPKGGSARSPAITAARPPRPRPAGRSRANRALLYSTLIVVGALTVYVAGASARTPALKSETETLFSTAGADASFTILAVEYPGTEESRGLAVAVRDMLRRQGFPGVEVLGYPPIVDDVHDRYQIQVGRGESRGALLPLLQRLRAFQGPVSNPLPFKEADIVRAPELASS